MKVIIINGYAGVGKSTFVKKCKELTPLMEFSTIDSVKEIAKSIGWTGQKELKDRKFLSDLKDLLTNYSDYPYQQTIEAIKKQITLHSLIRWINDPDDWIIFIHCREPEEIERFKKELNARSLIIRRHGPEMITQINHADNNVFDEIYDYTIFNDGSLDDLTEKAKKFIEQLNKEEWESNI